MTVIRERFQGSKPGERREGRQKGTPNKATVKRRLRAQEGLAEARQTGRMPLDIMLAAARGGTEADKITDRQLQAAIAAAPYVHPRLAGVWVQEVSPPDPEREARRKQTLAFLYKRLAEMAKPEPSVIEDESQGAPLRPIATADEWPR